MGRKIGYQNNLTCINPFGQKRNYVYAYDFQLRNQQSIQSSEKKINFFLFNRQFFFIEILIKLVKTPYYIWCVLCAEKLRCEWNHLLGNVTEHGDEWRRSERERYESLVYVRLYSPVTNFLRPINQVVEFYLITWTMHVLLHLFVFRVLCMGLTPKAICFKI